MWGGRGRAAACSTAPLRWSRALPTIALIEALSAYAAADTTRLTFPEGTTAIAMAQKMEQAGLCTAEAFLDRGEQRRLQRVCLLAVCARGGARPLHEVRGLSVPDTYEFLNDGTVHDYVATFYARFDEVVTEEVYAALRPRG